MKHPYILFFIVLFFTTCNISKTTASLIKETSSSILVFTKTNGYRHQSIEKGMATLQKLGEEHGFNVTHTEDSLQFNAATLGQYKVVVFLNTTGDVLGKEQEADFENYIAQGGSYMGIHSAADTEYDWAWYGKLVGGYFDGHPNDPNVRTAIIDCENHNHKATAMLSQRWERSDEWYNYKSLNREVNVLLNLDETSYEGGTNGEYHPIAWYHQVGKGKALYTGGGHTKEAYDEPLFQQHLLGALQYLME